MSKHDEARELVFYKNPTERRLLEKYISEQEAKDNKPTKEDIINRFKFEFGWNVRFNQTNDQILFADSDKVILVEYEYGKITYSKSISPKLAIMIAKFYGTNL